MAFTLHTSGGSKATAGANVNATIILDGTSLDLWSNEAESMCCNECDYDLVTNYATLTANGKAICSSICDAYVGQKIIGYEPGAVGNTEAALRLNLLQTQISKGLSQLKDSSIKAYLAIS